MHLVASAAVCLIAVVAFSHVGVHGGPVPSEPDVGPRECDSRLETCAGDFADAIREEKDIQKLCSHAKVLSTCLDNLGCQLPLHKEQEFRDGLKMWIKQRTPDCSLLQTDLATEHSTTLSAIECGSRLETCAGDFADAVRDEKDIQKLCSHAKVLSTCLDNLGCQLPLHKEQEFRDGLKMWIKQRTPDCSLLQTDLATEHSTTLSAIDCIPQIEASRCEKIFGAAIQSEENPAIVCLHAKAYANCIENLKCPISPDEKKGLFSMLQNFVDTVFPGCSLGPDSTEHTTAAAITTEDRATSLAAAITTEDRATSLAAAITTEDRATSLAAAITAITTEDMPTPDCLNKVRECADRLQQDLSSMVFSPDNYCSAANFFASCILKIDCTLGKEFKQQMIDAISSSVVNMAPDCKINTDVVEQTTEASITTINSTDFKMSGSSDCLSQIQECFNEYQKELTSGQLNLLCSSAKTFVSCVHNSECPHQEQAKQNAIEGFQTAILNVVPDCDINAVGPDDVEQTTEALSTAVDDIDFTTSVSPDCLSQIQECFNEYQKELTSGQLNLLCSSAKTFVSCVHNSECSHQEDAKQNAIEGFQTAILSVVPDCEINAIELDDGEQTTKSFITSVASSGFMTTGPSDCLLKIQGCFNNYQLDMTSGGFRPDLFCSFGKSFLSCVSSLECPNDEKAKQEAIDGFAPALLITTPDCDLSEIIKPRPDAAEQTTEAVTTTAGSTDLKVSSFSKSPTSTPDADTQTTAATEIAVDSTSSLVSGALNCLSQIQECNNNFQAAVSTSLFNKDVICSSTQSFVKCLMKVGCPIDPEVKKEALASITSTVLKIAPNCELPGVEPDTVKQTTEGLPMSKDTTVFFVNVSSENSCVNEVRTCQQTLFEAVTKPDFKKDEFCGLLKTMINCIGNISCGLTAEKKQEIYDISIKTAAEGGIFCAEPTGVTTESGASITDSIDILGICIDTRNVCLENFRDGINQNPENATNICQNMNTYIACYLAAPCPVSAEDKQIFLNKAQAMVNKSSLPCDFSSVTEGNPTSPLPTVVTTGEDQNSGEPTNLTTPEDVCLLKDFTCKKEFRTSSRSADKSPESICKYVNTYVSCLLSMPRCKSPEEKEELKESAMKFIEPKAPNCILDAFTEKPTTTEASSTTVADCQSLLDACSTSYEERGSKLMSPETACSNAKDYISCVYALPCLMAKAQREDIFENAKAVLFYSSPNCDIDTHQEELLAQEKEQTTESSLSSTLTDLLSMDTEEQTTTELATPTAANTQMESEKQTTADLGTTVADIATTLVSSVTDFDPFARV
ncbi:hypothetical protein RRG08_008813 [Elysia crispata]|uniref:Uncharacterized protein n=1 Tax=Elysia crispata TaxID=231223 RepID=A0AAE1DN60_9GAST|nr:hypothetical protein RRG08_008813 [Elysia crispata]